MQLTKDYIASSKMICYDSYVKRKQALNVHAVLHTLFSAKNWKMISLGLFRETKID